MQSAVKKAVFPVGGLGTRFLPVTKSSPKEMLPVIDKPLIQYAVEEARSAGIEEFIFVTGRGKSAIEDFFDYSYELNAELQKRGKTKDLEMINDLLMAPGQISYIRQQEPLGLGHAVWCARHLIGDEPFAVLLADDLIQSKTPCLKQMVDAYKNSGHMVAVQGVSKEETCYYGILDVKAQSKTLIQAKGIVEKPELHKAPSQMAVIGRYILDPSIFEILNSHAKGVGGEIQLTDALAKGLKEGPFFTELQGFLFEGKRFDCGTRQGLLKATVAFALAREDLREEMSAILKEYQFHS
ncbi:MAG: UTP--glucose-1-phosphate uridylyltransferase GalU [Proteobacteria bacterium]|nr:UTP--glucose-1-phosphate uridylyltransferase GalU [Pseudomonadota bacterium]